MPVFYSTVKNERIGRIVLLKLINKNQFDDYLNKYSSAIWLLNKIRAMGMKSGDEKRQG